MSSLIHFPPGEGDLEIFFAAQRLHDARQVAPGRRLFATHKDNWRKSGGSCLQRSAFIPPAYTLARNAGHMSRDMFQIWPGTFGNRICARGRSSRRLGTRLESVREEITAGARNSWRVAGVSSSGVREHEDRHGLDLLGLQRAVECRHNATTSSGDRLKYRSAVRAPEISIRACQVGRPQRIVFGTVYAL